jgi:hypothetical protein
MEGIGHINVMVVIVWKIYFLSDTINNRAIGAGESCMLINTVTALGFDLTHFRVCRPWRKLVIHLFISCVSIMLNKTIMRCWPWALNPFEGSNKYL